MPICGRGFAQVSPSTADIKLTVVKHCLASGLVQAHAGSGSEVEHQRRLDRDPTTHVVAAAGGVVWYQSVPDCGADQTGQYV
jgi:hypothetical protein